MENNDLVSIIVPVYNAESYIKRCVLSVQKSNYKNWELILIDDGSKDESSEICRAFSNADKRITVIQQQNGGPGKARNTGVEASKGKYIVFLDSDDQLEPQALQLLIQAMDEETDLVQCLAIKEIGNDSCREEGPQQPVLLSRVEAMENFLFSSKPIVHFAVWGKLIRKSVIDGLVFKPIIHSEDVLFSAELIDRCRKIKYIPDYLYRVSEREGSLSHRSIDMCIVEGKNQCMDSIIGLIDNTMDYEMLVSRVWWNKLATNIAMSKTIIDERSNEFEILFRGVCKEAKLAYEGGKHFFSFRQRLIGFFFCLFPRMFCGLLSIKDHIR